ncbi:hypothetical protein F1728_15340 [Gimesia benthica]|uniref:Uncharacterized protein n=1 Tax=Gimesia benthica TaxID=2608982 RepID=A0A6I6AFV2_9PLAN|nr:hypothetical protein [Gimesia benthica]QGQ23971.1 hypothetical protein F1728_15340 [Gimesia benthica]
MGELEEPTEDQEELEVPLWLKIVFLVFVFGSVWMIYYYGMILYLVFLLPFVLVLSLITSVIGLIIGRKEDQIFYMISLTFVVAILAVIFRSSTESVFRDEE